jgi:hypothetical protein
METWLAFSFTSLPLLADAINHLRKNAGQLKCASDSIAERRLFRARVKSPYPPCFPEPKSPCLQYIRQDESALGGTLRGKRRLEEQHSVLQMEMG